MKNFIKFLIFSLFAITTYAQQATEIDSKSLKLPRYADLTAIQAAIPTAQQGMMVYNIGTSSNWYHNGTAWVNTLGAVSAPLNLTSSTTTLTASSTNGTAANFSSNTGYALLIGTGNVGVGTTTPTAKLEVLNNVSLPGSGRAIIASINSGNAIEANNTGTGKAIIGQAISQEGVTGISQISSGISGTSTSGAGVTGSSTNGVGGSFSSSSGYALITGTGNVGVGTTTPTAKLEVLNNVSLPGSGRAIIASINSGNAIEANNTGTGKAIIGQAISQEGVTGISQISSGISGTSTSGAGVTGNSTNGVGGSFSSSSGYALITGTGNVGVGTTTPTAKLEVLNNVSLPGSGRAIIASINSGNAIEANNTGTGKAIIGQAISQEGVTGISQISSGISGTSTSGAGVTGSSTNGVGGSFSSSSGYALITGTGNVGVGTTTPTAKLEVLNNVSLPGSGRAIIASINSGNAIEANNTGTGKAIIGQAISQEGVTGISQISSGISGTSTSGAGVTGNSTNGVGGSFSSSSGYALIATIGNVGIGTSTPTAKLEVSGFTKLGDDATAPKIKIKKITGTGPAANGNKPIAHGIADASKILSVQIFMEYGASPLSTKTLPPNYTLIAGYEYQFEIDGANILISNKSGNSANIDSKNFRMTITYEQ